MKTSLICDCGKEFKNTDKYSVYGKNFCSMECLKPFKQTRDAELQKAEEERLAKSGPRNRFAHCDNHGSGNAF